MNLYKKHIIVFGLLLVAGLFQSCKVTKDYSRPELNLPGSYSNLPARTVHNIAEIPEYTSFFKNRELVTLLDSVMKNNPDLLVSSENILATEALMRTIKLNYLPDLNLQISAGFQRLSKNSMIGSFSGGLLFEDYTFAPAFSWEIDFWGKLKRQREEAVMNYLNQVEFRRALRVQLIALVAQGYYNLLSLDEQLAITHSVEEAMGETLEMLKVQYAVGEVNSLAIKQSEAQIAEVRALIPEIQASIRAQENALQALAGNYPNVLKRSGALEDSAFYANTGAGIPADLLANRPDVRQKELLLQAANARVGIARADFYPVLTITGQGGLNSIKASDWFSVPASLFGNAAAGLTQPLFNRRRIRSAYEQAIHNREAAVHEFRKSVIGAVEEVSTVLINIDYIGQQLGAVKQRTDAMYQAIDDAQALYQYGEATYLEVLTVQQSYFQTQMAHTLVIQKEINAYIALYKSLGGS